MRPMRVLLATVLGTAALLAAGCGGGSSFSSSGGQAESGETASLAPKGAGLWVTVDTDTASAQWQALDAVLAKVPGATKLVDDAIAQIEGGDTKLDLQTDVLPALGDEVVVVLPGGSPDPVVLLKPDDDAKLEALLATSDKKPVTGEVEGWTAVAQSQKALAAYKTALAEGTLADDDSFTEAMDGLPAEALARVYVNGKGLAGAFDKAAGAASSALGSLPATGGLSLGSASSLPVNAKALGQLGTIGLAVSAGANSLRVDGSIETASGVHAVSFEPRLLDRVPGDAFVAVTLAGDAAVAKQLRAALAEGGNAEALGSVEKLLGVSLDDVIGLAEGQGVLYARPSLIIPEITIVLEPSNPARALQTIDTAVSKLTAASNTKVSTTTQNGVAMKQVSLNGLPVSWGRDGDRIIVTTGPHAIEDFDGNGEKLVNTERFKQAAAEVGLGDETGGFAYVDVKALAPLLMTIATASGSGVDASAKKLIDALSAIDSIALNATPDGSRVGFQAAVRVS